MKTATDLVKIPFYGDCIEAYIDEAFKVWVNLRRICESLGVDYSSQYTKLRSPNYDWAVIVMITTADARGCMKPTCFIDLDSLIGWLVTIHPSKVAFEVRDKLRAFKKEAFGAAKNHFFGGEVSAKKEIDNVKAELALTNGHVATLFNMIKVETAARNEFARKLDSVMQPFEKDGDRMTLDEFHALWPILDIAGRVVPDLLLPSISRSIAAYSRSCGVPAPKVRRDDGKLVNSYTLGILQSWRANQDVRSLAMKRAILSTTKHTQPKLFAM